MKNLIYLALIIGTLYFIFSRPAPIAERASSRKPEPTATTPQPTPEQLAAKAREQTATTIRLAVRAHLRKALKDYDSLKDLRFSDLQTSPDGSPYLLFTFRAKNSFGAYVPSTHLATLNTNDNTVTVSDIDNNDSKIQR